MKRILHCALSWRCWQDAPAPNAPSSGAPASSQTVQEPPAPRRRRCAGHCAVEPAMEREANGGDSYYELAVLAENAAGPDGLTRRVSSCFAYGLRYADARRRCAACRAAGNDAACARRT